jgi:hypothetical protein
VISILESTADDMAGYEVFEVGTGHLNAHAAVQVAESNAYSSMTLTATR